MGQEDEAQQRRAAFAGYRIDKDLMATAGPQARFMHCLPAHRDEEVSADVIDGPQSVVWRQAENRMHAIRALFAMLATNHG
jgi:ornithine carbamoyltransferase